MERLTSIDLLISMRQQILHLTPSKLINNIVLYKGTLRKVFGGMDLDVKAAPHNKSCLNTLLKEKQVPHKLLKSVGRG